MQNTTNEENSNDNNVIKHIKIDETIELPTKHFQWGSAVIMNNNDIIVIGDDNESEEYYKFSNNNHKYTHALVNLIKE